MSESLHVPNLIFDELISFYNKTNNVFRTFKLPTDPWQDPNLKKYAWFLRYNFWQRLLFYSYIFGGKYFTASGISK